MKIAATIIGGECVASGSDLAGQKAAVKGLVDKYGAGNETVHVLYSSQRPAMRKRIALPKGVDPKKLYAEGVAQAVIVQKDRAKVAAAAAKALAQEKADAAAARKVVADKINKVSKA